MPSGPRPTGIVRPTPYICDETTPRGPCREQVAKGYNPLAFCACHLALYRERLRTEGRSPTPMGATAPAVTMVLRAGPWRENFRVERL